MKHSIIIPHRNRLPFLRLCLWSLHRSAVECHVPEWEWEAVVVEGGPAGDVNGLASSNIRIVREPIDGPFNKCRLLNRGIEAVDGDIFTFLDCDAIVGRRFMECVARLEDPSIHRVCYRVRYLCVSFLLWITEVADRSPFVDSLFASYNKSNVYRLGWEAYGTHDLNTWTDDPTRQPWGNSQWSVRRETLGDLRFDEGYVGHGQEDLDMLCRCEARWGKEYRGVIFTDPDHAMFHIESRHLNDWRDGALLKQNNARYKAKRKELLGR